MVDWHQSVGIYGKLAWWFEFQPKACCIHNWFRLEWESVWFRLHVDWGSWLLVYLLESSGMVVKVTADDSRWDTGLKAVWLRWNTNIFCVRLTIRQNCKLVQGCEGWAGPVRWLKWAPFAFWPWCRAKILHVSTG